MRGQALETELRQNIDQVKPYNLQLRRLLRRAAQGYRESHNLRPLQTCRRTDRDTNGVSRIPRIDSRMYDANPFVTLHPDTNMSQRKLGIRNSANFPRLVAVKTVPLRNLR